MAKSYPLNENLLKVFIFRLFYRDIKFYISVYIKTTRMVKERGLNKKSPYFL